MCCCDIYRDAHSSQFSLSWPASKSSGLCAEEQLTSTLQRTDKFFPTSQVVLCRQALAMSSCVKADSQQRNRAVAEAWIRLPPLLRYVNGAATRVQPNVAVGVGQGAPGRNLPGLFQLLTG